MIDHLSTAGLAKPYYEKAIELIDSEKIPQAASGGLHRYMAYYYYLQEDKDNISPVDKEELMHTFLSGRFRFAHKSRHLTHSGFYIYRQEFLIETLAEDIENALTQISGTQIEYFGTIAM